MAIIFGSNPCDFVMDVALKQLGTRNPLEVGTTLHAQLWAYMCRETGASAQELTRALREYPPIYPPPAKDLASFIASICRNYRHHMLYPYLFGSTD